jgi:hypothetical protein
MLRFLCFFVILISSNLATGAPADAPLPSIVAIDSESERVTFTDSVGDQWCYQIDPWALVWRTPGVASPSLHGPANPGPSIWTMKRETAVQALQKGVPPWVLSQLTGDAHPTPAELADFKESGGVSHVPSPTPDGASIFRARSRRKGARRYTTSSSYPATRVGFCAGLDPSCLAVGVHLDFTGESVGFKVGVGFFALTSALRVYDEATRLYLHGEATIMLFALGVGGGIGWDIPLGKAQSVVLQPQIGVQTYIGPFGMGSMTGPSGSISVNWGTPR